MSITLIIGSMYSGKSTTLLSYEKKFTVAKKNFVCINHSFDNRYETEENSSLPQSDSELHSEFNNVERKRSARGRIITHDNNKSISKTIMCKNLNSLNERKDLNLNELDAMIIDEYNSLSQVIVFLF